MPQGQSRNCNEGWDVFFNMLVSVSSITHLAGSGVLGTPVTVKKHQRQQKDRYGIECECSHVHLCGYKTLRSWYRKTLTANVNSKAA